MKLKRISHLDLGLILMYSCNMPIFRNSNIKNVPNISGKGCQPEFKARKSQRGENTLAE